MKIKIKLFEGGKVPLFKTEGAVCADAYARLNQEVVIRPGERVMIPLGFACELPEGWELQIRPRSGLMAKGIDECFGTGDWDYTGEYRAIVVNNTKDFFTVNNGDRICQVAIREVPKIEFEVVDEIKETVRGSNGFGSTGV